MTRKIHIGKRGGKYYMKGGKKVYLKKGGWRKIKIGGQKGGWHLVKKVQKGGWRGPKLK